jgi:xanthine/uracil permease
VLSLGCSLSVQGLQNLLANATGNAAPPIIIGLFAGDAYTTSYLIASAFIVSGIATILTVIRFRIPGARRAYEAIER